MDARLAELMGWRVIYDKSVFKIWRGQSMVETVGPPNFSQNIALCFSEVVPFMREKGLYLHLDLWANDRWRAIFLPREKEDDMPSFSGAPAEAIVEAAIKALE